MVIVATVRGSVTIQVSGLVWPMSLCQNVYCLEVSYDSSHWTPYILAILVLFLQPTKVIETRGGRHKWKHNHLERHI